MPGPGPGGRRRDATLASPQNTVAADGEKKDASYNVIKIQDRAINPISYLSNTLIAIGLTNTTLYVLGLIINVVRADNDGEPDLVPAKLFAAAQVFEHISGITDGMWRLTAGIKRSTEPRPILRLLGDNVPTVDVFIVTCGEPTDIVLDTVKAACQIDYPVKKMRVVVADDGRDDSLRQEVEELSEKHPNLIYFARVKVPGVHHGYKAGNLNTAFKAMPGGQSEFLAVLDADMIPEPEILRALIPHALKDDKIGMVTVAQHYYNIPNNDPLYQSNVTGTSADDGTRDSVGAAWCPGSGFIMRHAAWKSIGGFPEWTVTEDLLTSWMLHGHGWKIALLHEEMQCGLQPDCFLTHMKQRRRWWTGHVRVAISMNFTFNDKRLSEAKIIQRIAMFHHCCRPYMSTVFKMTALLLTAMCLFFDGPVVATPFPTTLRTMVRCVLLQRALARYADIKAVLSGASLWNMRRRQATNTWLGIHFTRDTVMNALPKFLGGHGPKFEVSGVEAAPRLAIKERDAEKCPSVWTRLTVFHQREGILWHGVLVIVMVSLIIRRISKELCDGAINGEIDLSMRFWVHFVADVGFPGLALIEVVPLFVTPIVYAIFPPTMQARRERMIFDEDTGLWRAAPKFKGINWTKASFWLEIPHTLGLIWLLFAWCVASSKTAVGG